MISFDSAYTGIGFDVNGSVSQVPINQNLRSVSYSKEGIVIVDSSGDWGIITYQNTPVNSNIELYRYLYPYSQINKQQTKKIEICSSELIDCFTNPVELVEAQGVGLIILPQTLGYKNKYNSVVYDFAQNLFVHCSSKTEADAFFVVNKGIINASANRSGVISNTIPSGVSTTDSFVENDSLVLKAYLSDATQGDGNLTIYVTYTVVEESWLDGVYCI